MQESARLNPFSCEMMKIGRNQYLIVPWYMDNKFQYDTMLKYGFYHVLLGERCRTSITKSSGAEFLLLGYALDAEHPKDKEEDMLNRLATHLTMDADNLSDLTLYWGGRWVLFILRGDSVISMTDCTGMKQMFYGRNVYGSQSRYVAHALNSDADAKAKNYIKQAMTLDKEYSWPLDTTPYLSVKRLLPNHMYIKGNAVRVCPSEHFATMKTTCRTHLVANLIKKMIEAASYRSNLAVTLTAGWDSRLVIAACDSVKEKIDVITLKYHNMPDNHIDILIPKQICNKYGYSHKILPCNSLDPDFAETYKEHSENAHEYWMQIAQSIRDYGYENWLWIKGSCNEVSRNSSGVLYDWQVNTRVLSKLYGVLLCEYSKKIIRNWLVGAKAYAAKTGYSVLDIFYWEHRMGSWLAECLNEADVVGETFTPFNVRAYFELIKYVPVTERTSPYYRFFVDVLASSGMNLDIPVNPYRYDSIFAKLKCILKNKMHFLYGLILNR